MSRSWWPHVGKTMAKRPPVKELDAAPAPAPAGPTIPFELPARVGLPAFLSDLPPNAKRVDIAGPLGKFVVEKNVPSAIEAAATEDDPIYRTPHPEVFVQLHFDAETRLVGVRLLAADPNFFTLGTKRWGAPDRTSNGFGAPVLRRQGPRLGDPRRATVHSRGAKPGHSTRRSGQDVQRCDRNSGSQGG